MVVDLDLETGGPPEEALHVPETLFETPSETDDSEVQDSDEDFVIPSQMHQRFSHRRRSSRIGSQS